MLSLIVYEHVYMNHLACHIQLSAICGSLKLCYLPKAVCTCMNIFFIFSVCFYLFFRMTKIGMKTSLIITYLWNSIMNEFMKATWHFLKWIVGNNFIFVIQLASERIFTMRKVVSGCFIKDFENYFRCFYYSLKIDRQTKFLLGWLNIKPRHKPIFLSFILRRKKTIICEISKSFTENFERFSKILKKIDK